MSPVSDATRVKLLTYDALGLCEPGEAHKMVERGDNTVGDNECSWQALSEAHTVRWKICDQPEWRPGGEGPPSGRYGTRHAFLHHK